MPSMPWVKLWTEILDDVKLAGLTDAQRWRFVQLILLAAECDAAGAIVTGDSRMTHAQVAWRLRCDEMTLESDTKKLIEVGLLSDDGALIVTNFATRQGPTQEDKRKQWSERQKKHRERVKKSNVTSESRVSHAGVTPLEEEEEKEEEQESLVVTVENRPNIFTLYENTIGPMTSMISEELALMEKEYPEDWVKDAFRETARQNKHNLKYTQAILKSWQENGGKRIGTKAENTPAKPVYAAEEFISEALK
jgi:DnaD/phage-associated family protein